MKTGGIKATPPSGTVKLSLLAGAKPVADASTVSSSPAVSPVKRKAPASLAYVTWEPIFMRGTTAASSLGPPADGYRMVPTAAAVPEEPTATPF